MQTDFVSEFLGQLDVDCVMDRMAFVRKDCSYFMIAIFAVSSIRGSMGCNVRYCSPPGSVSSVTRRSLLIKFLDRSIRVRDWFTRVLEYAG